jgi:hypothetical protein
MEPLTDPMDPSWAIHIGYARVYPLEGVGVSPSAPYSCYPRLRDSTMALEYQAMMARA